MVPRHPEADVLQELVYSGYPKCHGLKVHTMVFPNGLIGCLSARENDCSALNFSILNAEIMQIQPEVAEARVHGENVLYFLLYGDEIYPYCIASLVTTDHP